MKETIHGTEVSFPTFCPFTGKMEGIIKCYFSQKATSAWLYPMHGGRPLCIICTVTNQEADFDIQSWHILQVQMKYRDLGYGFLDPDLKVCNSCERVVDLNPGAAKPSGLCEDCWEEME